MPFARAFAVSIEIIVLMAAVHVGSDDHGGQIINHFWNIDVVVDIGSFICSAEPETSKEVRQIGVAFDRERSCYLFAKEEAAR